jgi:hypothetical protein
MKLKTPIAAVAMLFSIVTGCRKDINEISASQPSELSGTITATATTSKYIKVNMYGGSNAYSDAQWNNWNVASTLSSGTFKYSDGTSSAVSAALSQQSGVADNGTSYTATMAPAQVVRYASYSSSNRTLTLKGLDNSKTYDLEVYASRNGVSNNTTRFTVGSSTVDVKTDNNTSTKASFSSLVPSSGTITVNVSKLNTYNYINGWMLTENSGTTTTTAPAPDPVASTTTTSGTGKVYTLQPSGGEIWIPDASTRGWQGGDTLRIPAGKYSLIHIGKFKGAAGNPIVIINYGGQVLVDKMRFVDDAAYFKITGTGSSSYQYGFKVSSTANAGIAIDLAHDVEVNNVEVTGTEVGFYFKKAPVSTLSLSVYPNYVLSNYYIHHNYIHDVHGEGMYLGDTYPNADPYNNNLIPVRMDKVEVAYNIVDGTDWDGIQLSNARSGAKIHDNTVRNFGRINMGSQQAGIILGGNTTGDIYNNTVQTGTGNGIEAFGYGTINIYGNTVENAGYDGTTNGQEGIFCNDPINLVETNPKQQINCYNNIIKNPKPKGAIRVGAYNANSLASNITNNTVYLVNAPSNWLAYYVVSNAPGSVISGNTVIR